MNLDSDCILYCIKTLYNICFNLISKDLSCSWIVNQFEKFNMCMCFSFQLCRLFIHLMAPHQDSKFKFFALQLTKLNRGNSIFLNMLLGGITTKVCNKTFLKASEF